MRYDAELSDIYATMAAANHRAGLPPPSWAKVVQLYGQFRADEFERQLKLLISEPPQPVRRG